jgi:hypothetical protein
MFGVGRVNADGLRGGSRNIGDRRLKTLPFERRTRPKANRYNKRAD